MVLYEKIKEIRKMNHNLRQISYGDPNKKNLRLFYVRYADDWIILTNAPSQIAQRIKEKISEFLREKLDAILSEKKTLITNITEKPAHFLGFEIRRFKKGCLVYIKNRLRAAFGKVTLTSPDSQRIINKLYARGFCTAQGKPKEISWLSNMETHIIIQRYNASMSGLMQYYLEWVNRKSSPRKNRGIRRKPLDLHYAIFML